MLKNLKYILISIIIVVLVILYLIHNINSLKNELNNQKIQTQINYQNYQAYKDSAEMKSKQIQEYAAFVKDLSKENRDLKTRVIYLKNQFKILLDSIEVLNKPANVDLSDTNKIVIFIEGKVGKIHYNGQVIYFILKKEATHSMKIKVDPINIESIIFFDETDSLIKNKIYADGVLIDNAYTVIDSSVYVRLQGYKITKKDDLNIFDKLSFVLQYYRTLKYDLYSHRFMNINESLNIGLNYSFNKNIEAEITKDLMNDYWNFSIKYRITPRQIYSFIF